MYLFAVLNILADIFILWLIACVSHSEDRSHPLAAVVVSAATPYAAHLYPMIIMTSTIQATKEFESTRDQIGAFKAMVSRDNRFVSIMLSSTMFTLYFGGACSLQGIISSIINDRELTTSQVRWRSLLPMSFGLGFSMAYFNNMFSFDHHGKNESLSNGPLFGLFVFATTTVIGALVYGAIIFRSLTNLSEHQKRMMKSFNSYQLFFVMTIVPWFFLLYQMVPSYDRSNFLFIDYNQFVRLIFLFCVLTLEPISSRLRLRKHLYRTGIDESQDDANTRYAHQPAAVISTNAPNLRGQALPLPKKDISDDPPTYDHFPLPTYENASTMKMTSPWENPEVSLDDVKLKKGMAPVEGP